MHGARSVIGCCNIEKINQTYLNPGLTNKLAFDRLRVVKKNSKNVLSFAARERSKSLFSSTIGMSSFESYGFLTLLSLEFTEITKRITNRILLHARPSILDKKSLNESTISNSSTSIIRSNKKNFLMKSLNQDIVDESRMDLILNNNLFIGLQIRHQKLSKTFEDSLDDSFEKCLSYYVKEIRATDSRNCIILIASDRIDTIRRIKKLSYTLGCLPRLASRESKLIGKGEGEHGPWGDSIISMADLYLLSHSHYFIGTKISSYSSLMLNIVAARAALRFESKIFAWGIKIKHKNNTANDNSLTSCSRYYDNEALRYSQKLNYCKSSNSTILERNAFRNGSCIIQKATVF